MMLLRSQNLSMIMPEQSNTTVKRNMSVRSFVSSASSPVKNGASYKQERSDQGNGSLLAARQPWQRQIKQFTDDQLLIVAKK